MSSLEVLKLTECVSLGGFPESLVKLSESLIALELSDCTSVAKLPAGYGGLTKLRHLDFSGCEDLADVLYDDPVVDELEARGCGMFGPGFEIEPQGYAEVKVDLARRVERLGRLARLPRRRREGGMRPRRRVESVTRLRRFCCVDDCVCGPL